MGSWMWTLGAFRLESKDRVLLIGCSGTRKSNARWQMVKRNDPNDPNFQLPISKFLYE